jgi:hypothetical protein
VNSLNHGWAEGIRQELLGGVENGVAALRELPAAGWPAGDVGHVSGG